MKLSQKAISKTHRVMLFGPPKSGKTQLAGSLASDFNIIYFDLENGSDTLTKLPMDQQERIEVISIPDTRSFPMAIQTMLKAIKGKPVNICEAHGKVDCAICIKESAPSVTVALNSLSSDTIVIVDSITQLTNSGIAHITKDQPDDYKLQQDDWGNLGKLMDIFLSHVQQAPFNIICISHETEVDMVDGKQKIVPTAGTRNFSRNAAKYFDEVIYCEVRNGKHVAASSTTYRANILTGSRTGRSLENDKAPSLLSVFKNSSVTQAVPADVPGKVASSNLAALAAALKTKG